METKYDVIIIGGGIAGITSAIYLKNANKKVLIIEKGVFGGTLNRISEITNYPGFSKISGPDLGFNLYKQLKENKIDILNNLVIGINIIDDTIIVKLKDLEIKSKYLILATGKEPRKLNLENEDELIGYGVSYCALCDGPLYKNKDVVVVGAGDSAVLESLYLSNICRHVTILNKYDKFKSQEGSLKQVIKKENITIIYNALITKLNKKNNLLESIIYKENDIQKEMKTDGLFIYIGSTPNIFSNIDIDLDKNFIKVNNYMQTSIPNIYAVGDVIKKDLYQLTTAVSEATIAAFEIIKKLNKE